MEEVAKAKKKEIQYKCRICGEVLDSLPKAGMHFKMTHKEEKEEKETEEIFMQLFLNIGILEGITDAIENVKIREKIEKSTSEIKNLTRSLYQKKIAHKD